MLLQWRRFAHRFAASVMLILFATEVAASSYRWLAIEGRQVRWIAEQGAPVVLKYAIATTEIQTANAFNCGAIVPPIELLQSSSLTALDFKRAVGDAFAVWQRHIAITFVEAADQRVADIVIGQQAHPSGYAFANVSISATSTGSISQIDKAAICLNPQRGWKIGYDGNLAIYDLVHTLTHEIGHVIGLDHPADRGHVMSFKYHEPRYGLSEGDIQGAVAIYGARRREHSRLDTLHTLPTHVVPARTAPAPRFRSSERVTSRSAATP